MRAWKNRARWLDNLSLWRHLHYSNDQPQILRPALRPPSQRAAAASRAHDLLFARALLFTATPASPTTDALTLAEPLLADLDAFVVAMDEISGEAFLHAVPSGAGACLTRGGPAGRERVRQ
ncbi:hypothetical protein D1007_32215 [Hordeum vulgare]|nr:hypothetical protein D1007_32215 [Hordeum vulgare]